MAKAVGYVGVPAGSTDAAVTMDAQRGRIWAWCKTQGLDLDDIHAAPDGGAAADAVQAALRAASGATLVVDRIPCLAGSLGELAAVARRAREGGTRLVSLDEGIDTGADAAEAALRLLEAAAAMAGTPLPPAPSAPAFTFAKPAPEATPVPGEDAPPAEVPSPAWSDMALESGDGGFVDDAFDPPEEDGLPGTDACPPEMQISLGDLDGAEGAHFPDDGYADQIVEETFGDAPDTPHVRPRPLEAVSPLEGDLVPTPDSAPSVADIVGGLPVSPSHRTFPMGQPGGAVPKVRHRRESDYAVAAEKASRQVQKGHLEKALGIWHRFLKGAEGAVAGRAWNHLGDIHVRAGRPVEAIDAWLRAAQSFEGSHYNNMAVATLKKVLKLDASRAEVQRQVAELNARSDKVGDAVAGYLAYARHLKDAGRLAEALEVFARIRILDPVNARHRLQLAEELHTFGFEGEAVREALYAAELLLERGAAAEAEDHLRRWTERVPEAPELSSRLAALSGGEVHAPPPPGAGVEGGVLLTTGGAGRARADEPAWDRAGI